jgi:small subunit ribosomal protein S3
MGQKVSPVSFRVGVTKPWMFIWTPSFKNYGKNVETFLKVRNYFKKIEKEAFISDVKLENFANNHVVTIFTSRPNLVVKKSGLGIESMSKDLEKILGGKPSLNVKDVKFQDTNAKIIGINLATQVQKGASYLRAIKKIIANAMKGGLLGIKIQISGRLNGAEIARSETYKEGSMPLHTLQSKIDYAFCEAKTKYGMIGIKVWVYKK